MKESKNTIKYIQGTKTGDWINVLPSTVDGIYLGVQEWRNDLFLRYNIESPEVPTHCDDYNRKKSILHSLDCKKRGIITNSHNELRDGVANLAGKAFTPCTCATTP